MLTEPPIQLTERAATAVKEIIRTKNIPEGYSLRVGVRGGGCGGAGFFVGFDEQATEDELFFVQGLALLINKKHFMYMLGYALDFEERRDEQGFVFRKLDEPKEA